MINSVEGILSSRGPGFVRVKVGGIEFHLEASEQTVRAMPPAGTEVQLLTFLYVREDIMKLYGFASDVERTLFLQLLTVSGIGPRQALKMLTAAPAERLIAMLESEDTDALASLPGLGKKTAGRIVLQLRGKLIQESEVGADAWDDLISGLVEMGYDKAQATKAVQQASEEAAAEGVEPSSMERDVFRRALLSLG
ncbi:MAG: Holliday junction branch migration protein RuvA [Spirochaetaceae bacterium]|nr:MAG: Holliday junction branch migration protein RuvA [Spirochaetaceae bacterium]